MFVRSFVRLKKEVAHPHLLHDANVVRNTQERTGQLLNLYRRSRVELKSFYLRINGGGLDSNTASWGRCFGSQPDQSRRHC